MGAEQAQSARPSELPTNGESLGVDIGALSAQVRFNPEEGCVWLGEERMMLVHLGAFAGLRKELIDTFGFDAARGIITRMGHASGAADAALARSAMRPGEMLETFMAGPRLHAIEGMAAVDPIAHQFDPDTSFHAGEWIWRNSAEVDAHLREYGLSPEPVCWSAIGYASAYTSAFMGRPILYREVECRATGAHSCRIVGKPAELWDDQVRDDLHLQFDLAQLGDAAPHEWTHLDTGGKPGRAYLPGDRMVGASPAFVSMMHLIHRVAATDAPVLLIGEAGSGKKSCARMLHKLSKRSRDTFVAFNCASLTGDQLDAELFGLDKSDPRSGGVSRPGKIERAAGGTLFLEDIHCLDLRAQAKLLRLLQTGEVERIGGTQPRSVRLRLIASTGEALGEAVRASHFREDLYYKLHAFPVRVAPLRERRQDIPLLIRHFLTEHSARHHKEINGLAPAAIEYLQTHDFPGNIAELESMVERAVILAPSDGPLDLVHLGGTTDQALPRFFKVTPRGQLAPGISVHDAPTPETLDNLLENAFDLEGFESEIIARAVERAGGNLAQAARSLGMTRPQLAYRFKKGRDAGSV